MAFNYIDTRYNPINGSCLPGDAPPHTCKNYTLTLASSSIFNGNLITSDHIVYRGLPTTQVTTCGTCPIPDFVQEYLVANPSHGIEEIVRAQSLHSRLMSEIKLRGGSLFISLPGSPFNPNITFKNINYTVKIKYFNIDNLLEYMYNILDENNQEDSVFPWAFLSDIPSSIGKSELGIFLYENIEPWYESNKAVFPQEFFTSIGPTYRNIGYLPIFELLDSKNDLETRNYPYIAFRDKFLTVRTIYKWEVIDDTAYSKKLIRTTIQANDPNISFDQNLPFIGFDKTEISTKNLLITYNMNSCEFIEQIVSSNPYNETTIPEIFLVKYIPNTDKFLSQTNPEEFEKLKSDFEKKYSNITCNGSCCYVSKTSRQTYHVGCVNTKESECTVSNLTRTLITENPIVDNNIIEIVSVSWAGKGTSCDTTNCEYRNPPPYVLGTCCFRANNNWTCDILTQNQCEAKAGFWEGPQPNGIGGYNAPTCYGGGTVVTNIDSSTSVVTTLRGRDCSLLDNNVSQNPSTNTGPGIPQYFEGSCCFFLPKETIDSLIGVNSTILQEKEASFAWKYKNGESLDNSSPAIFKLSVLNDGSIIKLCSDSSDFGTIYNLDDPNFGTTIESAFNITNNGEPSEWKVKFVKVEDGGPYNGVCIILSVIKQ